LYVAIVGVDGVFGLLSFQEKVRKGGLKGTKREEGGNAKDG
jgi:hypothetical protein